MISLSFSKNSDISSARGAGVPDPQRFENDVPNEEERAERPVDDYCLIQLRVEDGHSGGKLRRKLLTRLSRRLRWTDELGVLSSNEIGVLLPQTNRQSGEHVCQKINSLFQDFNIHVDVELKIHRADSKELRKLTPSFERCRREATLLACSSTQGAVAKRMMDVFGASIGLLLLSPVMFIATVLVRLSSPGKVVYSQSRDGQFERPFTMYKFRTMVKGAHDLQDQFRYLNEQDGPAFKIDRDPRITRVGRFLRNSCIDELPQLWNVLKGEMSLVGPRPLPCEESQQCKTWQKQRLNVKPGMTCYWQIDGKTSVTFDEWMRMDLRYVRRQGLITDLVLIAQTVLAVLHIRPAAFKYSKD